jgi:hypothetical protein
LLLQEIFDSKNKMIGGILYQIQNCLKAETNEKLFGTEKNVYCGNCSACAWVVGDKKRRAP